MKAIVICRSDNKGQSSSVEKICTSTEEVMDYFAKCQPNSTLIFGDSFMNNMQFVRPDDYYDSLEEWVDNYLNTTSEIDYTSQVDYIFLQAVYALEDGTQTITNYILHAINLY